MFNNYFNKHLKEGEEAIRIVRRFYLTYAFHVFVSLIIILVPFFLIYPLFRLGGWGVIAFFLILFLGILYWLRQTVIYYLNALVITRERIIDFDQKGLFDRVVSESTYSKIQDVSFTVRGLFQTLMNYGDLEIQTAGTQANLEIKNIANPKEIQEIIVRIQQEAGRQTPTDLTAQELVGLVNKIKEGLGEEKFKKLVEQTKKSGRIKG